MLTARKHSRIILHAAPRVCLATIDVETRTREKREQQVRGGARDLPAIRERVYYDVVLSRRVRLPRQVSQEEIADFAEAP